MKAWLPSAEIAMAAAAVAILPYVAFNVNLIASAEGSIVHMAPGEWAIITAVMSLFLWLGSATILAVSAALTRDNVWLSAPLALLVFVGVAFTFEPGFWPRLFEPEVNGFGYWVFVTGFLSAISFLILWMWKLTREER